MSKKGLILGVLALLLLYAGVAAASGGEANVFVYHRFGDSRYPSTNIKLKVFSEQLAYLKTHHYTVWPLSKIVQHLKNGTPLPEHCVALTVDDAFKTFLTGAMPLLRRYHYPVTLFVSTEAVDGDSYLTWDELKALTKEGVEIGNHTRTHPYLLNRRRGEDEKAWRARVRREILDAQKTLQERLGVTPTVFAYPYGEFSPQLAQIVRSLGFLGAVGQQSGVMAPGEDLFTLPRFPMGGPYATVSGFRAKLAMRALPVTVLKPGSPVLGTANPPTLVVKITPGVVDLKQLRCYVPGQPLARLHVDASAPDEVTVQAQAPLTGRRSKYTLTAPDRDGHWYWFSQLWVQPSR